MKRKPTINSDQQGIEIITVTITTELGETISTSTIQLLNELPQVSVLK